MACATPERVKNAESARNGGCPGGRTFYELKTENVVLRDVVTETTKQISPRETNNAAGRRGMLVLTDRAT